MYSIRLRRIKAWVSHNSVGHDGEGAAKQPSLYKVSICQDFIEWLGLEGTLDAFEYLGFFIMIHYLQSSPIKKRD